jgi:putative inorganic carbon (HCO3(-)) transporter
VILLGIPLLSERRSLGWGIAEGRLSGGFLLGYCGILREELAILEKGRRHYGGALAFGVLGGLSTRPFPYLIPLLFFFLAVMILWHRLPELLLMGMGIGLPFFEVTGHGTVVLTAGVLLLGGFWWKKMSRHRRFLTVGASDLPILLLAALFAVSGALGEGRTSLACGVARGILMLSFFPAVSLLSRSLWRRRFLGALQLGGGICSLFGIAQYFFTDLELRWVDKQMFGDLSGRVCALFSNPNVLASYLILLIPLAIAGVMEPGECVRRRFFYLGAFTAEVLCLALTWCRGAWLGVLLAGTFLLLFYHRRSAGALFWGGIPLISLSVYLPRQVQRRFLSIGGRADSSVRYRYALWEGVRRMRYAHPWGIGVGEESFRRVYPSFAVSGTETVMHAHRWLGQIGVELGWVGVIALALLLGALGLEVLGGVGEATESARGRIIALASCILGFLIMGLFDYVWYHYGVFLLFWLLCACLCAIVREGEKENERDR